MAEVAEQDDQFLPLAYRLGVLAAFAATDSPPNMHVVGVPNNPRPGTVLIKKGRAVSIDTSEQKMYPKPHPLARAQQVGDELLRLSNIFDVDKPLPVAMAWSPAHHYDHGRLKAPTMVTMGIVENPRASFKLETPIAIIENNSKVASFLLPDRVNYAKGDETLSSDTVPMTTLVGLNVSNRKSNDPEAVYCGDEAAERYEKFETESAMYARAVQRRREVIHRRKQRYFR